MVAERVHAPVQGPQARHRPGAEVDAVRRRQAVVAVRGDAQDRARRVGHRRRRARPAPEGEDAARDETGGGETGQRDALHCRRAIAASNGSGSIAEPPP
ncbi:hypothetical protein GCM10023148_38280 [Actinokineospora soli]